MAPFDERDSAGCWERLTWNATSLSTIIPTASSSFFPRPPRPVFRLASPWSDPASVSPQRCVGWGAPPKDAHGSPFFDQGVG